MKESTITQMIAQLPVGRARRRYEKLFHEIGEVYVITPRGCQCSLWLVREIHAVPLLMEHGIPRWQIWTFTEIQEYLGAFGEKVGTLAEGAAMLEGPPKEIGDSRNW